MHLNPGFKVSKLCAFNLMIFKIKVHLSSLKASETPRSGLSWAFSAVGLGWALESAFRRLRDGPRMAPGEARDPRHSSSCIGFFQLCSTRSYCHAYQSQHSSRFSSCGKSDLEGTGIQHQLGGHNDLLSLGPYPL